MENRLLFALKCILLAVEEPCEAHGDRSLEQRAVEYGRSANITEEEINTVLNNRLTETLEKEYYGEPVTENVDQLLQEDHNPISHEELAHRILVDKASLPERQFFEETVRRLIRTFLLRYKVHESLSEETLEYDIYVHLMKALDKFSPSKSSFIGWEGEVIKNFIFNKSKQAEQNERRKQ